MIKNFFIFTFLVFFFHLLPLRAQVQLTADTTIESQIFDARFDQELSEQMSFRISNSSPQDTVRILRCIFKNYALEDGALMSLESAQHVIIDSCIFENIIGLKPGKDVHAIVCQDEGSQVVVSNSIFRNVAADGIQLGHLRHPLESHNIRNWQITGNAFYNSGENGIDIKNVQGDIMISGNFFTGSRGCPGGTEGCSGDAGIGLVVHQGASGVVVKGNTFYQNNRGMTVKEARRGDIPQLIRVEDNLFYSNISQIKEAGWGLKLDAVHGAVVSGNVFVDNHTKRDLVINDKMTRDVILKDNLFITPSDFASRFKKSNNCPFPLIREP